MIRANLFRRKGRTILTLLGIAIGAAAIIALGGTAEGLRNSYTSMAQGSQADLVFTQAGLLTTTSSVDQSVAEQLRTWPEVAGTDGMLININQAEGVSYFFLFGYDPQGFAIAHFRIVEGQGLQEAQPEEEKPLILGRGAAQGLDKKIGDTFQVTGSDFRVVGIYETGNTFEEGGAVIPLKEAQTLMLRPNSFSYLYVQLHDPAQVEAVQARAEQDFPDLAIYTTAQFAERQHYINLVNGFATAVSVLAIVVGGVSMTNTLFMSVLERTREIGLLRALGWRQGRVLRLILSESLVLSLLGGLVGVVLGVLISLPMRGSFTYMGMLEVRFTPTLFVRVLVVVIVLGFLGGLYPAWRASRLMPLEALRYEGGSEGRAPRRLAGGMALRNLWRRRTRTVLTIVGGCIGIAAIIAIGGIAQGYSESYTQLAKGDETDLMAIEADIAELTLSAIDQQMGARIAALPDVEAVSGIIVAGTSTEKVPAIVVLGYNPDEFAIRHFEIAQGEPLSAADQVIVGRQAADALDLEIGGTLALGERDFTVVGFYKTSVPFEDNAAIIDLKDAQELTGKPDQVVMYGIKLRNPERAEAVRDELNAQFPEIEAFLVSEFTDNLPDVEQLEQGTSFISLLAVIIGAVSMFNTMLMSVLERTREIGVLRALGWRRSRVLGMIFREALTLGIVAGALGILLGLGLGWIIGQIPVVGGVLSANLSPRLLIQAMIVALVTGTLGGLYPAWRATRLQPVEALRYE